jgi:hypothetical protein
MNGIMSTVIFLEQMTAISMSVEALAMTHPAGVAQDLASKTDEGRADQSGRPS